MPELAATEKAFHRLVIAFNSWSFDALAPLLHEEVELTPMTTLRMEPYKGPEEVREWMAEAHHRFGPVRYAAKILKTDGERLLAEAQLVFDPKASRRHLPPVTVWWVITLRDGLLLREQTFQIRDEACAEIAAGE